MITATAFRTETFPNRVWIRCSEGWASRPAVYYDHWRRRILRGWFLSMAGLTDARTRKALFEELQAQLTKVADRERRWLEQREEKTDVL